MPRAVASLVLLSLSLLSPISVAKEVLILAGPASHGWNEHEFPAGSEAIAAALNQSQLEIHASVSVGWPSDPATLERADAIVVYSDGIEQHVAKDRHEALRELYRNGANIAVLHFALEPSDPDLAAFLAESIGGYFEVDWSVNPVWTLEAPLLAEHAILNGVDPFTLEDEWYYHLRFPDSSAITPILSAHPPLDSLGRDGPRSGNPIVRSAVQNEVPQPLAWIKIGPNGQRGFGFTGGHYLHNWNHEAFRTLVLNAIVWTAGIQIPDTGVSSDSPDFVRYPNLSRAIAYNDLDDIRRHLGTEPELINRPGKSKLVPLHEAILRKKPEAALFLIERGADVNLPDRSENTPLHNAIDRKLPEVAKALIASGANLAATDKNGWTPLHLAAAKDAASIAGMIIDAGADIHLLSTAGGTPLHEAAASASAEMLDLLLDAGIDPSIVSNHDVTALDVAREFENAAAIEALEARLQPNPSE